MLNTFFRGSRVSTKLLGLVLVMIALMLALSFIAYLGLRGQKDAVQVLYKKRFHGYQQSSNIADVVLSANGHIYKVVNMINLEKSEPEIDQEIGNFLSMLHRAKESIAQLGAFDPGSMRDLAKDDATLDAALQESTAALAATLQGLDKNEPADGQQQSALLAIDEQEQLLCRHIFLLIGKYQRVTESVMPTVKSMKVIGGEMAAGMMAGTEKDFQKLLEGLNLLNRFEQSHAEASFNQSTQLFSRSLTWFASTVALAVLLSIVVALLIVKAITEPLKKTVQMISELEQGHLDVRLELDGQDEIHRMGQAMDTFAADLHTRVFGVNSVANQLIAVSKDIAEASQSVDSSADAQAKGVEKTSSAIHEISASSSKIGEGVAVLASSAQESTASALEMSANIEELAGNAESLSRIVDEVGASIAEMAGSIRQVATNTDILKESSDSTASSVSQMDASTKQVEESIKEAAKITDAVLSDAEAGKSAVEATISGIDEIRQASQMTADAIGNLSEKVRNIGAILAMIDDVTDQTSLLALNAAIIAAQAGEHGKGFAVVAEEIRELSNRTSVSTHEISSVINDIRQETDKVTRAIALTEKSVSEGEGLSSASGEALKKIVTGIHDVDRRMEQMSRATHEQSQGTRTIRVEMEKVSQMVDQTVSATREQSKSASSIMTAVENMKELTFQVKTSTREQSNGSKVIATTMEDINKMLQNINEACENQNHESSEISQAIEDIKQVADSNLGASGVLQKAVAGLNSQVQNLKKEMGFFRLSI